jgi:hypothetical protein
MVIRTQAVMVETHDGQSSAVQAAQHTHPVAERKFQTALTPLPIPEQARAPQYSKNNISRAFFFVYRTAVSVIFLK